jgi:hypothetical protein
MVALYRSSNGWHQSHVTGYVTHHVQRVSAKHGVEDDFPFLWEPAIFKHPPHKNPLTDRSEILHSWLRRRDHWACQKRLQSFG